MRMPEFIQTLDDEEYASLQAIGQAKKMSVQKVIRYIIIPDWVQWQKQKAAEVTVSRKKPE